MRILTINSGSSSIKFSLYRRAGALKLEVSGRLERIGLAEGSFLAWAPDGGPLKDERLRLADHDLALRTLFAWLKGGPDKRIAAAGHRVVHGGPRYTGASLVDKELVCTIRQLVDYAAEHLPHEIKAIEAVSAIYPELPQVACFDTSFHREMPAVAQVFALPHELRDAGIIRYGFHGLSYEFIVEELARLDPLRAKGRTIIAHLGNGASMCAVKDGRSVDTTMGFTPLGGLMMSTRPGDLDPGVIVYLLKKRSMGADELNELLNRRSGLLGVSGVSPDMADLLQRRDDKGAADAVELFCYQARKFIGALSAALGGLDTLVFTAGIGEHSPEVRNRICEGLGFLGVRLDEGRNQASAPVISGDGSGAIVRVIRTNEELMIARATERVLRGR